MSGSEKLRALIEVINRGIAKTQPGLSAGVVSAGVEVRGLLFITHDDTPIESFQVRIALDKRHPAWPPKVWETGERLTRDLDHHFLRDGSACLFYPPVYWLQAYDRKPFEDLLEGPVRNFFLYQCARLHGVDWPHGELDHGLAGVLQFFEELLGPSTSAEETLRLLTFAARHHSLTRSSLCPCGRSRGTISQCHPGLLRFVQEVPAEVVTTAASAVRDALKAKASACANASFSLLHHHPINAPLLLSSGVRERFQAKRVCD